MPLQKRKNGGKTTTLRSERKMDGGLGENKISKEGGVGFHATKALPGISTLQNGFPQGTDWSLGGKGEGGRD